MKRVLAAMAATAMMALALAGCGTQAASTEQDASGSADGSAATAPAQADSSAGSATSADSTQATTGKALIVYFTPANSDTEDAVSSATPRVGKRAAVAYIASLIGKRVDADMAQIVPAKAYPTNYSKTADRAKSEQDEDARPKFSLSPEVNPEDYDTVFVGYPMWWYQMPMVMRTFFDTYDFSGKTIVPFNTHAGSGDGGTYDAIAELEPDATVSEGLPVAGDEAKSARKSVNRWLKGLGY